MRGPAAALCGGWCVGAQRNEKFDVANETGNGSGGCGKISSFACSLLRRKAVKKQKQKEAAPTNLNEPNTCQLTQAALFIIIINFYITTKMNLTDRARLVFSCGKNEESLVF